MKALWLALALTTLGCQTYVREDRVCTRTEADKKAYLEFVTECSKAAGATHTKSYSDTDEDVDDLVRQCRITADAVMTGTECETHHYWCKQRFQLGGECSPHYGWNHCRRAPKGSEAHRLCTQAQKGKQ